MATNSEILKHALAFDSLLHSTVTSRAIVKPRKVFGVKLETVESVMIDTEGQDAPLHPFEFLDKMHELIDASGEYTVKQHLAEADRVALASVFACLIARREGKIFRVSDAAEAVRSAVHE